VDDGNRRIFVFLGALILALLVVLIVMLVTSEDPEPIGKGDDWRLLLAGFAFGLGGFDAGF